MPDPMDDGAAANALRAELSGLVTESVNESGRDLDLRSTLELVLAMNDEDARVAPAVRAAAAAIAAAVDGIAERMSRGGRLVYVGSGSSGRLGVLDAAECPPTFGIDGAEVVGVIAGGDPAIRTPAEDAEDSAELGAADLAALGVGEADAVVGIAASGRTPYVLGALGHAASAGSLTVAVAGNPGSAIGRAADIAIEVVTGPEFLAGSTRLKAGTAQKLVLNMLSTLTMMRLGKTFGNIMIDVRASNEKLRARALRTVVSVTGAGEDEALAALDAAGGSAKHAVLALLAGVGAGRASELLAANGGRLRAALEAAGVAGR